MRQQWMAAIALALGAGCCAPTAWAQAVIFANGYEPGPTCAPPAGLTLLAGNFDSIFGAWPYYNGPRRLRLPDGRYYALRFTATRTQGQYGTFDGSGGFPGDGGGAAIMSISSSPGCFDPLALPTGCYSGPAAYPGISWVNGPATFSCSLTPGAEYYLNITFGPTLDGAFCAEGICGRDFANVQAIMNP